LTFNARLASLTGIVTTLRRIESLLLSTAEDVSNINDTLNCHIDSTNKQFQDIQDKFTSFSNTVKVQTNSAFSYVLSRGVCSTVTCYTTDVFTAFTSSNTPFTLSHKLFDLLANVYFTCGEKYEIWHTYLSDNTVSKIIIGHRDYRHFQDSYR
jgi:uncharacterized protein YqhQ